MSTIKKGASGIARWFTGFSSFFKGFSFINDNKLWKYVIFPGTVSLALFVGITASLTVFSYNFITELIGDISGTLGWLLNFAVLVATLGVSFFISIITYRKVANIVVIPFLGPLLSKCEIILTGKAIEVSLAKDLKNALIGVWVGLKFLFIELVFLFLSFFTGPIQPFMMAIVDGYFLGRGIFEYLLEKHSQTMAERNERAKAYKPEMHGLGVAHFVVLLVPLFGPFIAPVSALAGATLIFFDEE